MPRIVACRVPVPNPLLISSASRVRPSRASLRCRTSAGPSVGRSRAGPSTGWPALRDGTGGIDAVSGEYRTTLTERLAPTVDPEDVALHRGDGRWTASGPNTPNRPPGGPVLVQSVEATIGVEPMNKGFADPRVRPLRHVAAPSATERIPDRREPRSVAEAALPPPDAWSLQVREPVAMSPETVKRPSPGGVRQGVAAPRGFEPRLTDPKSAVLPLDEGARAPRRRVSDTGRVERKTGLEPATLTLAR